MSGLAWAVAGLAGAGAAWWGTRAAFHHAIVRGLRAPRMPHCPPLAVRPLSGGRLRALRVPACQGRTLAAWLAWPDMPAAHPLPAVLAMHGWGANASTLWPVVQPLVKAGMAVLLLDARCHGDSDDEAFTSLPRFAEDIASGLRWLGDQPGIDSTRLALLGHSVGAAAALLHAARATGGGASQGTARVGAVVSLAAFAHPEEVMRRLLAAGRIPYPLPGRAVLRHVQEAIGARFDDIAPLHTIRAVACPVLLVHGREDETVPFGDVLRLQRAAAAAAAAEVLAVDGGHDLREALAPHAAAIVTFLKRALAPGGKADAPPAPPGPGHPGALKPCCRYPSGRWPCRSRRCWLLAAGRHSGPCRAEMPVLDAARRREGGIRFVLVNQGESAAAVRAYLQRLRQP